MAAYLPPLRDVEHLSPRVIRILGGNPGKFTLQGTNTYLVGTGPSRILIDTGEGYEAWRKTLISVLESEHAVISTCLLTHWHEDHVLGVPDLLKLFPAVKVYKHKSTIQSLVEVTGQNSNAEDVDSNQGILEITDGQVFSTQGARLTAIHSPGHTDDHIAFLLEHDENTAGPAGVADFAAIFTGDNVLGHGTTVFEDLASYIASLKKIKQALGKASDPKFSNKLYPAHGEVIKDGRAKIDEYIKHRKEREDQVLSVLSTERKANFGSKAQQSGWSSREITKVIYKDYDEGVLDAAERGVRMVLRKLESENKVRKEADVWWFTSKAKF